MILISEANKIKRDQQNIIQEYKKQQQLKQNEINSQQRQIRQYSEVLDTEELCPDCRQKISDAQEERKDMIFEIPRRAQRTNERLDTDGSLYEKKSIYQNSDTAAMESACSLVAQTNMAASGSQISRSQSEIHDLFQQM